MPTPSPMPLSPAFGPPTGVAPYAWIAIVAAAILIVMLLSGHGDHDVDHDLDHDFDHDADHDYPLQILSVRTALAFFTGLGAVGGTLRAYYFPHFLAIGGGFIAGLILALIAAFFMHWLKNQQRNSSWSLAQTEGQIGTVVERIPPGGVGRVKLRLGDEPIEKDARLEDPNAEMPVGSLVTIIVANTSHFLVRLPTTAEEASEHRAVVTTILKERGVID